MKTRCPCCGASASLDVLINHDEARNLIAALAGISDDTARAALRYLSLFRPAAKDLGWARAAKLLGELVPMMQAGTVSRKGKHYPAPREAWLWAFARALEARDNGRLQTPLTTHGWLLENLTFWSPEKTAATLPATSANGQTLSGSPQQHTAAPSSTLSGAAAGERYRR